jgi:alcohol dehydrogenase class IV
MRDFIYNQPAVRVRFGTGSIDHLAVEMERIGARRAIILATPGRRRYAELAAQGLGSMAAAQYCEAVMHVPIETVRAAGLVAKRRDVDCYVTIGGGSTIGLAKALALESGLPILAVPTTYAGSEMTSIYGITDGGIKRTGRDIKALPKTVLYDPALTLTLPPKVSGPSGINALAHCIEGLYAEHINPIITLLAAEGIRSIVGSLPRVVREPDNLEARSETLYGAWLAGCVLGAVGMGVHHKLCHVLGGTFNLPHAEAHTVILPHAVAFNREAAADAMGIVEEALGLRSLASPPHPAQAIYDLAVQMGAPVALKEIGMPADGLDRAAKLATENPYYNPRPVDYAGVRQLLENAYHGKRPS